MPSQTLIQKHFRRNYLLGIANGALFGLVDAVWAPALVLALFVAQLGGSDFMIGLLPAIYNGGWFLPQFLISHRVQQLPYKKHLYIQTSIVRIICLALLVTATLVIGASQPALLLLIFFILFTAFSFLSGLGGNAFMIVVGKEIPPARRGSYFGTRDLAGTSMGLLAGYLVSFALGTPAGWAFPNNFAFLFLINLVAVTLGVAAFGFTVEPEEKIDGPELRFRDQLVAARRLLRENRTYRRFLVTRFVLAVADIATPFYAIFATRHLGAPEGIVGLYIGLTTLTAMVTNPLWSWMSDHRGNRGVLLVAAWAALAMPTVALAIGLFANRPEMATPLGLVFLVYGTGRTAANIAFPTLLLEIAPPAERSVYIGFTNTVLGVATFIPAVGGILLDLFGFTPVFSLAIVLAAVGLWLATGLRNPRRARAM